MHSMHLPRVCWSAVLHAELTCRRLQSVCRVLALQQCCTTTCSTSATYKASEHEAERLRVRWEL
jgi:hypothetical protein